MSRISVGEQCDSRQTLEIHELQHTLQAGAGSERPKRQSKPPRTFNDEYAVAIPGEDLENRRGSRPKRQSRPSRSLLDDSYGTDDSCDDGHGSDDQLEEYTEEGGLPNDGEIADDNCCVCLLGHSPEENQIVFCDGPCLKAYHQRCLVPVLEVIPEGDWYCSNRCERGLKSRNKPTRYSRSGRNDSEQDDYEECQRRAQNLWDSLSVYFDDHLLSSAVCSQHLLKPTTIDWVRQATELGRHYLNVWREQDERTGRKSRRSLPSSFSCLDALPMDNRKKNKDKLVTDDSFDPGEVTRHRKQISLSLLAELSATWLQQEVAGPSNDVSEDEQQGAKEAEDESAESDGDSQVRDDSLDSQRSTCRGSDRTVMPKFAGKAPRDRAATASSPANPNEWAQNSLVHPSPIQPCSPSRSPSPIVQPSDSGLPKEFSAISLVCEMYSSISPSPSPSSSPLPQVDPSTGPVNGPDSSISTSSAITHDAHPSSSADGENEKAASLIVGQGVTAHEDPESSEVAETSINPPTTPEDALTSESTATELDSVGSTRCSHASISTPLTSSTCLISPSTSQPDQSHDPTATSQKKAHRPTTSGKGLVLHLDYEEPSEENVRRAPPVQQYPILDPMPRITPSEYHVDPPFFSMRAMSYKTAFQLRRIPKELRSRSSASSPEEDVKKPYYILPPEPYEFEDMYVGAVGPNENQALADEFKEVYGKHEPKIQVCAVRTLDGAIIKDEKGGGDQSIIMEEEVTLDQEGKFEAHMKRVYMNLLEIPRSEPLLASLIPAEPKTLSSSPTNESPQSPTLKPSKSPKLEEKITLISHPLAQTSVKLEVMQAEDVSSVKNEYQERLGCETTPSVISNWTSASSAISITPLSADVPTPSITFMTNVSADAADPGSPTWACMRCTFENKPFAQTCEICDFKRPRPRCASSSEDSSQPTITTESQIPEDESLSIPADSVDSTSSSAASSTYLESKSALSETDTIGSSESVSISAVHANGDVARSSEGEAQNKAGIEEAGVQNYELLAEDNGALAHSAKTSEREKDPPKDTTDGSAKVDTSSSFANNSAASADTFADSKGSIAAILSGSESGGKQTVATNTPDLLCSTCVVSDSIATNGATSPCPDRASSPTSASKAVDLSEARNIANSPEPSSDDGFEELNEEDFLKLTSKSKSPNPVPPHGTVLSPIPSNSSAFSLVAESAKKSDDIKTDTVIDTNPMSSDEAMNHHSCIPTGPLGFAKQEIKRDVSSVDSWFRDLQEWNEPLLQRGKTLALSFLFLPLKCILQRASFACIQ